MLLLLYHATIAVDRLLASSQQRLEARTRARYMRTVHGSRAVEQLHDKLRDGRRRKSRRVIRLAIAELIGGQDRTTA